MTALTIHPSTKSTYSIMSAARKRTQIVFLCALMFLDVLVALSPERKPIDVRLFRKRAVCAIVLAERYSATDSLLSATRSGKSGTPKSAACARFLDVLVALCAQAIALPIAALFRNCVSCRLLWRQFSYP